jgi:hypothetical protein
MNIPALYTQLRRVLTDASLYLSDDGRVYDASEVMWLSAPTTHCDIPRTGHSVYGPNRLEVREPQLGALPHFGIVRRGSVDGDVTLFDETMGVAVGSLGARPVPDTVGMIASSTGAFSEALVIGRLPGDTPSRKSRVVAPDVIKSTSFVYPDHNEYLRFFLIQREIDNCKTYTTCVVLGQCDDLWGSAYRTNTSLGNILSRYGPTAEQLYIQSVATGDYCVLARCVLLSECAVEEVGRHRRRAGTLFNFGDWGMDKPW